MAGCGVNLFKGSGVRLYPFTLWNQEQKGGPVTAGDDYGYAITTGDYDGDGYDDLAISAPGDDEFAGVTGGHVQISYGTSGASSAETKGSATTTCARNPESRRATSRPTAPRPTRPIVFSQSSFPR